VGLASIFANKLANKS